MPGSSKSLIFLSGAEQAVAKRETQTCILFLEDLEKTAEK